MPCNSNNNHIYIGGLHLIMNPPCVPTRWHTTRSNTLGRAHAFSLNSFHWRPLLVGYLRKAWLAEAVKRISMAYEVNLMAYCFVPLGAMLVVIPRSKETDLRLWAEDIKKEFTRHWLETRPFKRAHEQRIFSDRGCKRSEAVPTLATAPEQVFIRRFEKMHQKTHPSMPPRTCHCSLGPRSMGLALV